MAANVLGHYVRWNLGLAQAQTQTTAAERDAIARHATGRKVLAEIGVWHGVTTARIRRAMAPDANLYAVDPFPVGRLGFCVQERIAHREVGRIRNGVVHWVKRTGREAAVELADRLAGRLEFIFIDGDHTYDGVAGDWNGWAGLIAPGGVIGLHDSRATPERPIHDSGSVRFTEEVVRRDPRYEVIDEVDSLTVVRRRA
jgi:predicted O-methyltransferase YrrM